eukprot:5093585-Prymnesium_polylepis.1
MRVAQGSGVAAFPQRNQPAIPHGVARPRGSPVRWTRSSPWHHLCPRPASAGARARMKDQLGLIRAFQAKIRHWSDISAPICR